jgi:sugar O-acyltransferase (sialic acid O-acetyltransferase NeuD family)
VRRLAIYGTGGLAREVLELVRNINARTPTFEPIGWLDDDAARLGTTLKGLPVLGAIEDAVDPRAPFDVVIGIGNPPVRRRIAARLAALEVASPALVDPRAWTGHDVAWGPGCVVCAGALITTDVRLGHHVFVNLGVTVGHDAVLEDFVTVAPSVSVSGNVHIGEGADLGTGAVVIQGVRVGAWSIVGAGTVVVRDVPANVTAVGVPAKVIRERPAGWHEAPSGNLAP